MKRALLSVFVLLGIQAFADVSNHDKVTGNAYYAGSRGAGLESKNFIIYLPKAANEKVVLELDGKQIEATAAMVRPAGGRKVLTVILKDLPGMQKGTVAMLRGTLLKAGTSTAYYGDFFFTAAKKGPQPTADLDDATAACLADGTCAADDADCCDECDCSADCDCGDKCDCDANGKCNPNCDCAKGCKHGKCGKGGCHHGKCGKGGCHHGKCGKGGCHHHGKGCKNGKCPGHGHGKHHGKQPRRPVMTPWHFGGGFFSVGQTAPTP